MRTMPIRTTTMRRDIRRRTMPDASDPRQCSCGKSVHVALSRGQRLEGVLPEHREVELHPLIGVLEIGAGELADPLEALPHGVAVKEQRPRDRIQAAVVAQELFERTQLLALLALGERAEDRPAERADLRGRPAEDEAVRAEVTEGREPARTVERAA